MADLSNPILKPWAVEQMRKANEEVIADKIPFTADSRCYPAGVPSFLLFPAIPVRFIQTPTQVLMIRQHARIRRIYLRVLDALWVGLEGYRPPLPQRGRAH